MEKILEKSGKSQGILSVRKSGNPVEMWLKFCQDPLCRKCPPWYVKCSLKGHEMLCEKICMKASRRLH